MADRYFDRNGITAGFGTLTGNWDTTTANWSTSAAGTATPATFTFTNADAAYFGSDSVVSTTAGTATILTGVTVTLNGIYTRNLSAAQTVAAGGTGNLVFAGTTPFTNLAQTTNISAPISGSAGLAVTLSGSTGRVGGVGTRYLYATGSSSGLTGACSVTGGRFIVGPATTTARYQPSSLNVDASGQFDYYPMSNTDFTFPCAPTGNGFVSISGNHSSGGGVTFSVGQLTSFGGIVRVQPAPDSGFQAARVRLYELPSGLDWFAVPNANSAMTGEVTYLGTAATYAASMTLDNYNNTSTPGLTDGTYKLTVPDTSGALNITGTVQRLNTAATASARMSLTLGGSNTGNNTLSGDISEVGSNSAILGIIKVDAGRWVLSGANSSHTGIHTVSAGTLSAQSAKALGSATSTGGVAISGTGILELAGGITLDKSVTDFTLSSSSPLRSVNGSNTLQTKQISLTVTATIYVDGTDKLTIAPQGAGVISGTGGIAKTGTGELELTAKANTFTGDISIVTGSTGKLTVGSVADGGSPAAWGAGVGLIDMQGTLKYVGATGSSSRQVRIGSGVRTLEASGTGPLTLSNVTQTTAAKTITLRGTNTDANTISNGIANGSELNATTIAKEDAGRWVLSGALTYTGTTAVNGGTLRVETGNSNTTTSVVTIGASGTVELITDTLASTGATSGEVLGTGNVTCNGIIKTRGGTTQKGQVRYGGNLTFGAGSSLYIGAAA